MPYILYRYDGDKLKTSEEKILHFADSFLERVGAYPNICKMNPEEYNDFFSSHEKSKINGINVVASQYIPTKNHYQLGVENDSR